MCSLYRGDIYLANLGNSEGFEIGGIRPVLVISNKINNQFTPTVLVVPISSVSSRRKILPTHIRIEAGQGGLERDSIILMEQIKAIDKSRLEQKVGSLPEGKYNEIQQSLISVLGKRSEDSWNEQANKQQLH